MKAGWTVTRIAEDLGRSKSVISREIRRSNVSGSTEYRPASADQRAADRRKRPQTRKVDRDPMLLARVRADLRRSRTPRQVAGRLTLEAKEPTLDLMEHSLPAGGATVSHEALYRWIYAMPKK